FELKEYKKALDYYHQAAKLSLNDPLPLEKIAQLYEHLGNDEFAQNAALKAAEVFIKNREVNKAIENWARVTRINPENIRAHSRLALVYERLSRKQQAVTEYLIVASLFQNANDMEKAVKAVKHALQILPGNNEAHKAMELLKELKPLPKPTRPLEGTRPVGVAPERQLEEQKTEDALPEMNLDPVAETRQKALSVLAGMLFESLDEGQNEQYTQRGLQAIMRGTGIMFPKQVDNTRIVLHLSQVIDLQTNAQIEQAADELERAMEAGLDHAAGYFDLGLMRAQTERLESALRNLKQAVKHPDFALGARLLLGETLQKMGRKQEALVEYLEALSLADSQVVEEQYAEDLRQLYEPLIEVQRQQTDAETQSQICDNVNELLMRADWREHLRHAREQLPAQTDGGSLIPIAEILTQARSSQVVESLNNIYQLARSGYLLSAMEEAFYALHFAPTYLPLHTYIGELLLTQDHFREAIDKFIMVAQSYNARGQTQRAIDLYRRVIKLTPLELTPRSRLIDQLIATGQIDDALKAYLEFADVHYSLADLTMARKTYTEALQLAQQSKADRAWQVKILHCIADIDLQSLEWRQALRLFERICSMQPDDEKARSGLIDLNFRLDQEAQALAELDNYIAYLRKEGKNEKAIEFMESLASDNPDQISIRPRLARVYRQLGRIQDAITQLDVAGKKFLEMGYPENAIHAVEAILVLKPPNASAYQRLLAQLRGK
ncbi:MAG TPA: tetratricopeptide repeat protein, partial [bacterium]|nr:tetratricopeptide repeat protein [bacterium]